MDEKGYTCYRSKNLLRFELIDQDGYFRSLRSRLVGADSSELILTFEGLLRHASFAERLRD